PRVRIPHARGRRNSGRQNRSGLSPPFVLRQHLRVHLKPGHVFRVILNQGAELRLRPGFVSFSQEFQCQAVTRKRILGILRDEFFQLLPAAFLLVGHGDVPYYTWWFGPSKLYPSPARQLRVLSTGRAGQRSIPNLKLRPRFRKRNLQIVADQDVIVFPTHAVIRCNPRSFLHTAAPILGILHVPLQQDDSLARVIARAPEVIILMSGNGFGQTVTRTEEVDRASSAVVAGKDRGLGALL